MKKSNIKKIIVVLACVLLAVILTGIIMIARRSKSQDTKEEITFEEISKEPESSQSQEETTQEETEEETETITYPQPEYDFTTEEVNVAIEGLDREYTFVWVSDLHLVTDHEAGDGNGDARPEYLDAIDKRYEELAITEDGVHAEELWPEIVRFINCGDYDGAIFGGDMMDYCSNSNVKTIKEGLDQLHIPYMYVRADHDYGVYYGGVFFTEEDSRALHKTIDGDEMSHKFWDMGDFIVLGIDNSTKDMPEYYYNMVADVYSRGKPVIMVTHVPYASREDDSLAELSMQVRNQIYYWSEDSEHYKPNDVTQKYLNMLYDEDTIVEQVLAGHLHASWDGMMTMQLPEHIFGPAFQGHIGIIHVVPK